MALSIRSKKVEELARLLANRTGLTMTEAIAEALKARLAGMSAAPDQLFVRLQAIAKGCASAPDLDTRATDEILGYNADGCFGHDC